LIMESLKGFREAFNEVSGSMGPSEALPVEDTSAPSSAPPVPSTKVRAPSKPIKRAIRRHDAGEDDLAPASAPRVANSDYSIPESEIVDLPDQLQSLARNVKTKKDYDLLMKMVAESMVMGDDSGH